MTDLTTIYVCTKCRSAEEAPDPLDERAGARLHRAIEQAAGDATDIHIVPVECLSVCKRPVTVGFAGAGKWTYVYGDFGPDSATDLIACARSFGRTPDGLVPWKERPAALRQGVIARFPPRP
jgi:predicted metal-binding protein